jgi:L-gulonate 3-dehydrogenase
MAEQIAVVGGGSIGVAWALTFARAGLDVAVQDPDPQRREAVPHELRDRLDGLATFELLDEPAGTIAARVTVHEELAPAVAGATYVQECAPESLDLKRELFAQLDAATRPDTVLASSSSAIICSAFAGELAGRERCLVAHPGNPPYLLPVVELVPAPFTRPDVVDRSGRLLTRAGMHVVQVRKEIEGFVFNRLQGALLREAYCLVRDGVASVDDVDRVVRDGLGRRWAVIGPFETADLNMRGGIEAHASRMGPAYERMGAERGQRDPWTPELVRKVAEERRRLLALDQWAERVAWRDRMLMALERARRNSGRAGAEPSAAESDRVAISSVLHRYCAMLDRMELDLVPSLFTADCLVVYGDDPGMQSRGAADLALGLRRLWRFARTSHHLSNVEIDLDGVDTARARSYVLAWHQRPDGTSNTLYAQYHDRLVRTDGGWKIAERRQLTHGSDEPWDRPLEQAARLAGDP